MTGLDRGERFPLSVIVLTFNESKNIGGCLECLDWVDDVIVVDSGSTDGTIAAAESVRPDARIFENPFEDFGAQRNWALDETSPRHEWVLFLDADERCTAECAGEVRAAVEEAGDRVGFYLTCRNMFLGRWIKRCTFFPSWQLRLLKLGAVRFRKEGHGQREISDGPLGYISKPYNHFGFSKGVADWIERHNQYSTDELELIARLRNEPLGAGDLFRSPMKRRRCLKRLAARMGFRPLTRFFYTYVLRGGFLDGMPGLYFCLLRVAHEIHITVKLAELGTSRQTASRRGCEATREKPDAVPIETELAETVR